MISFEVIGDELGFDGNIRWLRMHSVFPASTLKRLEKYKRQL